MSLPTNVLSGTAFDSQGNRVPLAVIEIEITDERGRKSTDYLPGGANLYGKVSTTADEQGDWSTPLVPNVAPATQNTRYRVTMIHPDTGAVLNPNTPLIQMPDEDTTLSQLIPPNPISTEAVTAAAISAAQALEHKQDAEAQAQSEAPFTDSQGAEFDNGAKGYAGQAGDDAADAANHAQALGPFTDKNDDPFDKGARGYSADAAQSAQDADSDADRAEAAANSITTSETPEPDRIPKPVTPTQFLAAGWLNPNEFPLANQQDRERFFRNVLQPAGIDIPPDVLFWPSPYREGGYEATVARPGTGWTFNNRGVLVPNGADVLRRDFDPATGAFLGALAEPQREGLATNNDDLTHPDWDAFKTVTVAPFAGDAPFPAFTITDVDGETGPFRINQDHVAGQTQGDTRVISVFAKAGTKHRIRLSSRNGAESSFTTVDLTNGDILLTDDTNITSVRRRVTDVGGGWYKIEQGFLADQEATGSWRFVSACIVDDDGTRAYSGDGTGTLHIALPNIELDSNFASSPIVTGSSATIRPADTLTLPQVGDRRRGCIVWEGILNFDPGVGPSNDRALRLPFGRLVTRQSISVRGASSLEFFNPTDSGFATISATAPLQNRLVRIAYLFDSVANVYAASVDGVYEERDDQSFNPPPDDPIQFGQTDTLREGRSHTHWCYISYNVPSIAQIEALTGEVAP